MDVGSSLLMQLAVDQALQSTQKRKEKAAQAAEPAKISEKFMISKQMKKVGVKKYHSKSNFNQQSFARQSTLQSKIMNHLQMDESGLSSRRNRKSLLPARTMTAEEVRALSRKNAASFQMRREESIKNKKVRGAFLMPNQERQAAIQNQMCANTKYATYEHYLRHNNYRVMIKFCKSRGTYDDEADERNRKQFKRQLERQETEDRIAVVELSRRLDLSSPRRRTTFRKKKRPNSETKWYSANHWSEEPCPTSEIPAKEPTAPVSLLNVDRQSYGLDRFFFNNVIPESRRDEAYMQYYSVEFAKLKKQNAQQMYDEFKQKVKQDFERRKEAFMKNKSIYANTGFNFLAMPKKSREKIQRQMMKKIVQIRSSTVRTSLTEGEESLESDHS